MCARQCHCSFLEDKKVYCPKHRDLIKGEVRKSHYISLKAHLGVLRGKTMRCQGFDFRFSVLSLPFLFMYFFLRWCLGLRWPAGSWWTWRALISGGSGWQDWSLKMSTWWLVGWLLVHSFVTFPWPFAVPALLTADLNIIISGSMAIDCLGILTELSDCKRKLFPVGYQWVLLLLLTFILKSFCCFKSQCYFALCS